MSFLREYAASEAGARRALTLRWLAERPRELFAELQRERPVFATPGLVLVTRQAEAIEVLTRGDVFLGHALEARRQPLFGGFSLDEREGPRAAAEAALVRLCVRGDDADRVASIAHEAATAAVSAGCRQGRFEVVRDLAHVVAGRVAAEYLGVGGPEESTLVRWVEAIGRDIERNPTGDSEIHEEARAAAAELGGYTDTMVASRRAQRSSGRMAGDDVLGRLVALQNVAHLRLEERRLREVLLGLLAAGVEPIAASISLALGELIDRPGALQVARAAAASGDDDKLWAVLREALRFSPPRLMLARSCGQSHHLAQGTADEVVVPAGATVVVATAAAAFDPARVDEPEHFRVDRPEHPDFLFGEGPHACVARHVATAAIREACKALLGHEFHLSGPLRRDGGRPISFPVELAPLRAAG
ncbi:cytochrome P450 [Nannocystis sp. ILAH1]|uniref:cytochrome P450 n=1 Tax=unclassified Nannocystis TaxID=2627009 RepID=UPI002271E422|nr:MULTISPECIES: cytochrome P450 [unclassified Nannocystis]MCY0985955.1 cytochrome P450 [Nannocystis sp. ILAH1]MCY1068595.1 cytochrome P450 [Nannocystis sp. RBIL2]